MPKNKYDIFMDAVAWIANNDEPLETNIDTIAEQLTVVLVADVLNGGDTQSTARWVKAIREKA